MDQIALYFLLGSLIVLFSVAALINYLRHRHDNKDKLFFGEAFINTIHTRHGETVFSPAHIIRSEYPHLFIRFPDGHEGWINRAWLLKLDELPPHLR